MSLIIQKKSQLKEMLVKANTLRAEFEQKVANNESFDATELNNLIDQGTALREEITRLEALDQLGEYAEGKSAEREDAARRRSESSAKARSWGAIYTASEEYKSRDANGHSQPVNVKSTNPLLGSVDAQGGYLVFSQRETQVRDQAPLADRTLLQILNTSPTTSDAIEYIILNSFSNNAAPVAEYASGNFGLAPQSDLGFALGQASVKDISHYVLASKRILADAPVVQNMIDVKLAGGLELKLEDKCLNGDGTGENFLGILQTPNIQLRAMHATTPVGRGQVVGDTVADTLRRSITDIRLAFYKANAIVLNPSDAEDLELQKDQNKNYMMIYDPIAQRIWRVPVVESVAIAAKTALTGDFVMGATLWDRQQADISTGAPNDLFLRKALAILANVRAAFAVTDPKAFEKVSLL